MAPRLAMVMGFAATTFLLLLSSAMAAAAVVPAPVAPAVVVPTGRTYKVGGDYGWTTIGDPHYLRMWASSRTFYVGDVLQFQYDPRYHNVVETLGQDGHRNRHHHHHSLCNYELQHRNVLQIYTSGNDSVTLGSPGFYSFLSGFNDDCYNGLYINVPVHCTALMQSDPYSQCHRHHHHFSWPWSSSSAAVSTSVSLLVGMLAIYWLAA